MINICSLGTIFHATLIKGMLIKLCLSDREDWCKCGPAWGIPTYVLLKEVEFAYFAKFDKKNWLGSNGCDVYQDVEAWLEEYVCQV